MMKTSKCRPKEVFEFFFVILRFFSETIFLWTSSNDIDEIMMMKCGFKFNCCSRNGSRISFFCRTRCMTRENSSKCRPQRFSSMMRGKRCFFFRSVDSENFQSPGSLKKKCRWIKKFMRQMFWGSEALSYWQIEAWTVFLLSIGVLDEDYSQSLRLSSSSDIFTRR